MRRGQLLSALFAVLASYHAGAAGVRPFARTNGTHFVANGRRFYSNGFNAYWLMSMASDAGSRSKVSSTFQQASGLGMTVARTWAFSDGGQRPLQCSPGSYNEDMFKGLDFVISEAKKYGVYLILSLVNNWSNFGGRKQYVQWAREQGQNLSSDDDFYTSNLVKGFYKNHVKALLTRNNTITGVAYKDDPIIFAWELMNEPRCLSDLSGTTLQGWIEEMAAHVKSMDSNHMVEIGLEGFYGGSMPVRKQFNPGFEVGADFIANNQVQGIDFLTIHAYPDQWIPTASDQAQVAFARRWIQAHIGDAATILDKPLMITEFGKSSRSPGYSTSTRDGFLAAVYDEIYASAVAGGPCTGGLFWQLLAPGMDSWRDGYEVVVSESPATTTGIISQQSNRISDLDEPGIDEALTRVVLALSKHAPVHLMLRKGKLDA